MFFRALEITSSPSWNTSYYRYLGTSRLGHLGTWALASQVLA